MTLGFLLGERQRGQVRTSGEQSSGQSADPIVAESSGPAPKFCPEETLATATRLKLPSELYQVLKIETDNGTVAWICTDSSGGLYYQGKTGGADQPLAEGKNGLFLSGVKQLGPDAYEVLDHRGNRFVITREEFELHFANGKVQTNAVVEQE
ncbi:MAG: hypothetical protein ABW046_05415 [Actinoplanes sp.]